jgi:hypothetical protein
MKPLRPLVIALCAFGLFAGCASKTREETADGDRYILVQETGSLIPKRVKVGRAGDAGHNLKVEGSDSPTLNQMARKQMLDSMPRERSQ